MNASALVLVAEWLVRSAQSATQSPTQSPTQSATQSAARTVSCDMCGDDDAIKSRTECSRYLDYAFEPPAEDVLRDVLRTFTNLMLTCRELYHDLPWAMPKWCFAEAFELGPETWDQRVQTIVHWLDTFQVQQQQGEVDMEMTKEMEEAEMVEEAEIMEEGVCSASATWLETRFLVYAWLGATWSSEGTFLRSKLLTASSSAPGGKNSRAFWRTFTHCGRVWFASLQDLQSWAAAAAAASVSSRRTMRQTHAARAEGPARTTQALPATSRKEHEKEQEQDEEGQTERKGEQQEQAEHDHDHDPQHHHHDDDPHHDDDDHHDHHDHHHQQQRAPALFSLVAVLNSQADADQWHELRATLLGNARGHDVCLCAQEPLDSLMVSHVDSLELQSADINHATFHDVRCIEWWYQGQQQALQATFHTVSRCAIDNGVALVNVSPLAAVPDVSISCTHNHPVDLSPLRGVQNLRVNKTLVVAEEALSTAQRVDLHRVALTADTLHAAHVKLSRMTTLPDMLHLPRATHVELEDMGPVPKLLTCPPHLDQLVVDGTSSLVLPTIPDFEHAHILVLKLRSRTAFTRERLADLSRRACKLVLSGCVTNVTDLHDIPDDVQVSVEHVERVDGAVPPCVTTLHVRFNGELHCKHLGTVPCLALHASGHDLIHDFQLLSGRRCLHLNECTLAGEVARCQYLVLNRCCGCGAFAHVDWLVIHRATVVASPPEVGNCSHLPLDDSDLSIAHCRAVFQCHLRWCRIKDFACFEGVQRLVLKNCYFDKLESLPHIGCVVLRRCSTTDRRWRWPDRVLVNRSPQEMRSALLAGKVKSG
ncbi:hypothetical protein PTSG_11417 [Salpingoeca rosetta]|uniref:Uncharacterized protein n=1 Tax=Salpingoeca rosetta (strain ATCC 50818 / BSB-021) TaxID=946362 RepID=F2UTC4_SALR5|nr:uncharacterized protein PTSG_11417 [Salpingoeca rosetta]EGD82377.1 hypothetical protein PTSG_11417 [Salpingoeca rosetta]|eukprot:XP_004987583.1 hypothetical protein PTSG_11417 [Salpingoeca rosetta]